MLSGDYGIPNDFAILVDSRKGFFSLSTLAMRGKSTPLTFFIIFRRDLCDSFVVFLALR